MRNLSNSSYSLLDVNFENLRGKGKAYATTLSDSDSEESCDGEGSYSAFMTITNNESSDDLNLQVQELGDH